MGDNKRKACCNQILQKEQVALSLRQIQSDPSIIIEEQKTEQQEIAKNIKKQESQLTINSLPKKRAYLKNYSSQIHIGLNSTSKIDLHKQLQINQFINFFTYLLIYQLAFAQLQIINTLKLNLHQLLLFCLLIQFILQVTNNKQLNIFPLYFFTETSIFYCQKSDINDLDDRFRGLSEDEKQLAIKAEQKAIVKNSYYEKFVQSRSDIKLFKINSMLQALNLVVIVASFLDSIRKYGQQYKFKRLKETQFQIIGDQSSNYRFYFDNKYFIGNQPSRARSIFIRMQKSLYNWKIFYYLYNTILNAIDWNNLIILPDSLTKKIWDSYILFLLSLNIFYIPIKITWEEQSLGGFQLTSWVQIFLNDLPGWTFLADIILNFNTAYFSKGQIIYNRVKIIKNYLKTKFLGDLLVVVPFIISLRLNLILLNSVLILRTNKMFKLANYFEQLVNFTPKQTALYNLFKLIFTIVFVAHFAGCMFFFVGSMEMQNDVASKTWIQAANLQDRQWYEQYVTSLYWAVITMITIGYGDVTPITIYERIYVIFVTLMSCGVFAYSLNQIGLLIQALTKTSNQLKQRMNMLTRHLRHRGVCNSLQIQVRKYFEYWHQSNEENDGEECDKMIESLSNNLKKEVLNDIRNRLILKIPILVNNFSPSFLKNIANHIKTKRSKPEEILIDENQINDKLYFLASGQIVSYINIKKDDFQPYTILKNIKVNSIFDQISFMGDLPSLTGYRSVGSCMLYYINKEDFNQEIKNFPQDQEKYQLIKDNIVIYKSQRNINTKCNFCDKYTHSFDCCPYVKYIPYREKTLILYRVSVESIRKPQERREFSHKVLSQLRQTKERAVQYLIERNPYQNEEELIERLELVNFGEQEFYEQYMYYENQTNRTNLTYIQEEQYLNNVNDSEQDYLKQNSVIIQQELNSPIHKIQHANVFQMNRGYTNHDSSLVAAGFGGEINSNFEPTLIQKNNSNLNSLISVHDNIMQQQQSLQAQQNVNLQSQILNQQIITPIIQSQTGQQILENSVDNQQLTDSCQANNGLLNIQTTPNINFSAIKKKAIVIAKSPQLKKRNIDLNILLKQNQINLQSNQHSSNSNQNNFFPLQITASPRQHSSKFCYIDIGNRRKTIEESENRNSEDAQLCSAELINNVISQQKKKSFHKILSSNDQQQQLSDDQAGLDRKLAIIKNSEKKITSINYVNSFEQDGVQNQARRNSTSSRQVSIQQIPQSNTQLNQNGGNQHQMLQHQQYIYSHSLNNNQNMQAIQISQALAQLQKTEFMVLLGFDKMKEYNIYYPSGNYTKVIEKIENILQKQTKRNGRNISAFKKSVNKVIQICQLQNMILKKQSNLIKTGTPGTKKNGSLLLNQDSIRIRNTILHKRNNSHQQSSFQLAQQTNYSSKQDQENVETK
ncbi:cation channel family protein (macronuclear) [Tetrahymena thermophila SB210]|uniref:Cation channel family protein n=1 Tax=Tetrahymena thermophila (strain SB210) TaxID=312017 RepID=I7LWW8_TETTS|nr:cation channel family protein [Tetrahymena thermophila SB210]EAS03000.2 cation channel family protein [Tetrahymena thermophila SB210]|eukprot:XP_001023245.2 cation channel family protein [Tetrahymena thermophila SB210]